MHLSIRLHHMGLKYVADKMDPKTQERLQVELSKLGVAGYGIMCSLLVSRLPHLYVLMCLSRAILIMYRARLHCALCWGEYIMSYAA